MVSKASDIDAHLNGNTTPSSSNKRAHLCLIYFLESNIILCAGIKPKKPPSSEAEIFALIEKKEIK